MHSSPWLKLEWLKGIFLRYGGGCGAILPWLGGLLLVLGAGFAVRSWSFVRTQERASATVTEDVAVNAADGILYYPRLRFRAGSGVLVQVLGQPGSDEIEFPAGTEVPVLYPVDHPERAIIGTVWRMYSTGIVLAVLGVVVFDLGLVMRIAVRRMKA